MLESLEWDHFLQEENIRFMAEHELLSALQRLEEMRTRGEELPQQATTVEARLLTHTALMRLQERGLSPIVERWMERAVELAPQDKQAAYLQAIVSLHRLLGRFSGLEWPVLRQTDNPAARKTTAERLFTQSGDLEAQEPQLLGLVHAGRDAADRADHQELRTMYERISEWVSQWHDAVRLLREQAGLYLESLSGMYHSSEVLATIQQTLKRLVERQRQLTEDVQSHLFPVRHRKGDTEKGYGALRELADLVGLAPIKERIRQLARFLKYQQMRVQQGFHMTDRMDLHLVLMGNPGTGKTTIARLIAKLYHELGLIERPDVVEVDRSHLVGPFLGQTEQRTMDAVKRAVGGVLFIDEAYSLKRADSHGNDYGQAAVDTLVAAMTGEEYAGRFVVILAGYPEEMRAFLQANPGLRSRFPETGHFLLDDYSEEELVQIGQLIAKRNDFVLTPEAVHALRERIRREKVDQSFGNARTVKHIILDAIYRKGNREGTGLPTIQDYVLLQAEDLLYHQEGEPLHGLLAMSDLVGLAPIKAELEKVKAFLQIQQERVKRGLRPAEIELHAVFLGNPGTGKTTVARLYADILRETGYLKRGHLVAVSRADLVAGYVGQTARLTRQKIREALGGVLFVDEAYSLFSERDGDFGREAISVLVEEMSRHRDNLVVVLAGYPHEMAQLMASNPGLLSRFKKHFLFPDYTVEELLQIVRQKISIQGYVVEETALAKLRTQLERTALNGGVSGNGRFAQSLVQEAIQQQAFRLVRERANGWSEELLQTLVWEDFASALPKRGASNDASVTEEDRKDGMA